MRARAEKPPWRKVLCSVWNKCLPVGCAFFTPFLVLTLIHLSSFARGAFEFGFAMTPFECWAFRSALVSAHLVAAGAAGGGAVSAAFAVCFVVVFAAFVVAGGCVADGVAGAAG